MPVRSPGITNDPSAWFDRNTNKTHTLCCNEIAPILSEVDRDVALAEDGQKEFVGNTLVSRRCMPIRRSQNEQYRKLVGGNSSTLRHCVTVLPHTDGTRQWSTAKMHRKWTRGRVKRGRQHHWLGISQGWQGEVNVVVRLADNARHNDNHEAQLFSTRAVGDASSSQMKGKGGNTCVADCS